MPREPFVFRTDRDWHVVAAHAVPCSCGRVLVSASVCGFSVGGDVVSYDVYIHCSRCGNDLVSQGNMTSNLSAMWAAAGCDVKTFDKRPAYEMLPALQRAIHALREWPEDYKQYEPDNGWGDLPGCLEWLEGLRDACCSEPFATVKVSR
jgi:hypothetical protein